MIIRGNRAALETKAVEILADAIARGVSRKQQVVLGVVGGTSVGAILQGLALKPVPWELLHLFMVDERAVPVDHPDSNFRLVSASLGGRGAEGNLHPFIHRPDQPCGGTRAYQELFEQHGGRFDIVLLSSGEDGHVASLFPDHDTVKNEQNTFLFTDAAPKPPPQRMTASARMLRDAAEALLLFFGPEKQQPFDQFLDESLGYVECPAKLVQEIPSHFVLTDQEQ